jgi:hypothetical protein
MPISDDVGVEVASVDERHSLAAATGYWLDTDEFRG